LPGSQVRAACETIKTTVKQNIVRSRKELETMIERLKHEITVLKKGGTVA